MTRERSYDIVVFGATGFTGRLVAQYLAEVSQKIDLRWALAGRSLSKLEWVRSEIAPYLGDREPPALLEARSDDPASLSAMAKQTRVVLTTVGPYVRYGEPLVEACVREGADYVDITGEPRFVNMTIERYDEAARAAGVRIVSCCGFDSIPHDLGALFTVEKLPRNEPITVEAFIRADGNFSGGTWQSALNEMGAGLSAAKPPAWMREPLPDGRSVGQQKPRLWRDKELGGWVVPLPTIDPQTVLRSARKMDVYGPEFRYSHNFVVASGIKLAAGAVAMGAVMGLSQIGPARRLLSRLRPSGEGPSADERARSWFQVTFRGTAKSRSVTTRVSGGDAGYTETSKMIAESALCLAFDRDRLPSHVGVVTPAAAMGDLLIARLQAAGIRFELLEG